LLLADLFWERSAGGLIGQASEQCERWQTPFYGSRSCVARTIKTKVIFPQPGGTPPVSFHRRCISPPQPPPPAATSVGRHGHLRRTPRPPPPDAAAITNHLLHPRSSPAISSIRRPSRPSHPSVGSRGHLLYPVAPPPATRGHHRSSPLSPVITDHLLHPPAVAAISSIRRPPRPSPASAGSSGYQPRPPRPPTAATSGGPSRSPQPPSTATSGGPARPPPPPDSDLCQPLGLERAAVWTVADNESYTSRLWEGFFAIKTSSLRWLNQL
jgi:hypothetical protein